MRALQPPWNLLEAARQLPLILPILLPSVLLSSDSSQSLVAGKGWVQADESWSPQQLACLQQAYHTGTWPGRSLSRPACILPLVTSAHGYSSSARLALPAACRLCASRFVGVQYCPCRCGLQGLVHACSLAEEAKAAGQRKQKILGPGPGKAS